MQRWLCVRVCVCVCRHDGVQCSCIHAVNCLAQKRGAVSLQRFGAGLRCVTILMRLIEMHSWIITQRFPLIRQWKGCLSQNEKKNMKCGSSIPVSIQFLCSTGGRGTAYVFFPHLAFSSKEAGGNVRAQRTTWCSPTRLQWTPFEKIYCQDVTFVPHSKMLISAQKW